MKNEKKKSESGTRTGDEDWGEFKARQLRYGMGREGFLPRSFKLEFKQKTYLYIQAFNSPKSPQPIQIPDPDPR